MRKQFSFFLVLLACLVTATLGLTYCASKKQDVAPAPLATSQNAVGDWTVTAYQSVSESSPVVAEFQSSTDYAQFDTKIFGTLSFNQAHLASFAEAADFQALHVPLLTSSGGIDTTRFLLAFYDKPSNSFFTMVREMDGVRQADGNGNLVFTGSLRYYTPDGYIVGGVVADKNHYVSSIESNVPKTAAYARYPSFNACYQAKKKECSDDWVCDVACTFNPGCVVAYVAACVWDQYHP